MSIAPMPPVTLEQFLRREAEAGEGVRLELIHGEIRETDMTTRNAWHPFVLFRLSYIIETWLIHHPQITAFAGVGEVRCEITQDPPQIVGIDLGVWMGPEYASVPESPSHPRTPPVLAVEVLSPSDTHGDVSEKRKLYLDSGVEEVWYVDPELRAMTIHRNGEEPELLSISQRYVGQGTFSGLEFDTRLLFERGPIV